MNAWKYTDGDWDLNESVSGDAELIQSLEHLLYTRVTEWFLNLNHGFNRDVILQKKPNDKEVTQVMYDVLFQEPRVRDVT